MSHIFLPKFRVPTLSLLGCFMVAASAHAADSACKPLFAALEKAAITPNHQFGAETDGPGKTLTHSEVISTGKKMYVMTDGKWTTIAYDAAQTAKDMQAAEGQASCKYVRDEAVGGEAAAVYSEHREEVDVQVWISKSRGLPLRQTIDSGGTHNEVRFDYANVKAPAGI